MDKLIINKNIFRIDNKDMIDRAKMLALHKLGKPILSNVKSFRPKEKAELINLVKELLENIPEEQLIKDFNELADDKLFQPTDDYTTYPIIQMSTPSPAPIEDWKVKVNEEGIVENI
jgi:hypothetical protein